MTSAPRPDLVDELGSLAAGLCDAQGWVILPTQAAEGFAERSGGSLPEKLSRQVLRDRLVAVWRNAHGDVDPAVVDIPGLGNVKTRAVLAVPLRASDRSIAGALCLINRGSVRLTSSDRRALQLIAARLERALPALPDAHHGALLASRPERTSDLHTLLSGIQEEDPLHGDAEADTCEHYERMERFEGALLGLVKAGHDDLATTLGLITEVAAQAIEVERVEIWQVDEANICLRRRHAFPSAPDHDGVLCADDCPRFFEGLDAKLVMAISDTEEDLRGKELMARLPIPDVGAALIVPIWLQGKAVGVLAHFHTGSGREWSRDEQDFSGAVAGIVALALEADAHRHTEAQLHALAAHLDEVREEERAALARELHDELGQMLTALRMDVSWLGKACTTQPEKLLAKAPERTQAMKQLLDEAVATVQRISGDLRPGPLHELGLVAALEWQLSEFKKRSGIETMLVAPEGELAICDRTAVTLYRALQEALTNVARHAAATEVRATLRVSPQRISLEIRDNGKGISEAATRHATSLGLIGMRERAGALGGEVIFRGAPGQGTAVLVSLPNNSASKPDHPV